MMFEEFLGVTVRSLMMIEECWASRCALLLSWKSFGRQGGTVMICHEFLASRCTLSGFLRRFGRHGALSFEEFWASRSLSHDA